MSVAILHSAPFSPHVGRLEFGPTRRQKSGWAGPVTMAYDGDEWTIDIDMIDAYLFDMVGFFEEIAAREWSGMADWRSEDAEVGLRATRLGEGTVGLDFHFWWASGDTLDNERKGQLHVREDALPRFAAQIRELTGFQGEAGRLRSARQIG